MAKEAVKILKPSTIGKALISGVVLFCLVVAVVYAVLPQQNSVNESKNYAYVYSGAKSASVPFAVAGAPDNAMLLFGSSELSTPSSLVAQVPAVVFGEHNYGLDLMFVGEAFDQSLWQGIAAAAYAPQVKNKKVAIIVSPTWFENGGIDNETFKLRFSYSLYRAFCDNPQVSQESKSYVAERLAEQGIDATTINAGLRRMPHDYLNDAILSAMDDLKLRADLQGVRELGIETGTDDGSSDTSEPADANAMSDVDGIGKPGDVGEAAAVSEPLSFADMRSQALIDAQNACTNNDWGINSAYWEANLEGRLEALRGNIDDETFTDTPEYDDFAACLRIMKEVGFDPLVIVSPLHGEAYDLLGADASDREACYERIRSIAEDAGAEVVDFSDREYEVYFLHDIVHFGWLGWVDVEEALYDFANNK